MSAAEHRSIVVFAPAVVLTITIEATPDAAEIHLHGGGQGYWVAQLVRELGVDVTLVGPFGGETGVVLKALVASAGVGLHAADVAATNGAYVHDRRGGEREVVAEVAPQPLTRHDVDALYGAVLVDALEADVCVLAGPGLEPPLSLEIYERLATDLRANGKLVVADLSGDAQQHALRGGVTVLKVAGDELVRDGAVGDTSLDEIVPHMDTLVAAGAENVVVTLADQGLVARLGAELVRVDAPPLTAIETRGAGDSLTAALAAALARGESLHDALRLGAAAGALNVTRRGLGTGSRGEIERLSERVEVDDLNHDLEPEETS